MTDQGIPMSAVSDATESSLSFWHVPEAVVELHIVGMCFGRQLEMKDNQILEIQT